MRRKSLLIQDTNSVVVHVINCLDNLNEETSEMWDLLCQAEHYFQFEYLKAVAKSNIDISFRYFLAELEGKLVGISFGYIMRFPIIGPIKIPTFISGTPVDLGFPFAISETVDQAVIFKALIKSMLDEARKSGTKFIAIRDVWDIKEIKCFESIFMDLGLQKVPLFNSAILDIKWNNFDEYLQALSHRYRGQVKYDLRKVYRSGYELKILHGNEAIPYCADFHRLWVNVFKSHPGDRDQVYLPVEYFKEMVSLPETVSLLMLRNAKLVGFDLLEKRGGLLDSTFCGQDYLLSGNDPVDRALTHEIVRYAIENGFGLLDFGVSNEAVKARIGCTFRELFGYVRPTGMNFLKISWVRGFLLRGYNLNMDTTYFPKQNVFQTET